MYLRSMQEEVWSECSSRVASQSRLPWLIFLKTGSVLMSTISVARRSLDWMATRRFQTVPLPEGSGKLLENSQELMLTDIDTKCLTHLWDCFILSLQRSRFCMGSKQSVPSSKANGLRFSAKPTKIASWNWRQLLNMHGGWQLSQNTHICVIISW